MYVQLTLVFTCSEIGRIGLKSVVSVVCLILEYPGHGDLARRWMRDGLHVEAGNRSISFKPGSESSLGSVSA